MRLLDARSTDELKADYCEAQRRERAGVPDASEARRLVTVALVRRIGRDATSRFERTIR
jgi:hypothetical protein